MTPMSILVTVALALITSAGFWATVQLIVTRKGRTAEAAQLVAKTEKTRQDIATGEIDRRKLIDEIEANAVKRLHDDHDKQRGVIVMLIDVLETFMFRMRAAPHDDDLITLTITNAEYLSTRATLNDARIKLR